MSKRVAIVGTAQTWKEAPWGEKDVAIHTLNDAYMLGMPRIDVHYEMHPLNQFVFRKPGEKASMSDVPFGFYLRPEGHLEWLHKFAQTKRLWLQHPPPEGWPEARQFPRDEIREQEGAVHRADVGQGVCGLRTRLDAPERHPRGG